MPRQSDAQKFIGKSRAPRVQIEYDVEVYGAQKKVELPFVVGVMSDLSGDNSDSRVSLENREFESFSVENFDERMTEIEPTLRANVPNVLTNDGTLLDLDLKFRSMADFEPGSVVQRVPELARLLEARNRLTELISYMDGKISAESVIEELLKRTTADEVSGTTSHVDDAAHQPGQVGDQK
ncbi:type VI secretion system contractile sheath small subunit [Paraburkholderia susongensis]|uniref:Type VI secretion system protein ImpB n=1 Tax=Paraburkholderia susongensis TaxID=1515439 RepID=A0A1X7M6I2_9BURK|nr:type VI secretion system contractile sheath small subunit [Paraburkholderia susongensis]SMG61123.1 type VI secretion system protein ImpB [Paraburkholderia susongensis]